MEISLVTNARSKEFKTKAFITQGRFHILLFKVNNMPFKRLTDMLSKIYLKSKFRIEPYDEFKRDKNALSVFLEADSTSLNFQVLEQSKSTSTEHPMEPILLRCLKDMVAVMYRIRDARTVIIYQLYQEPCGEAEMSFEEINFVPEHEIRERSDSRPGDSRYRLRKILEIEHGVTVGSTLHDMFFFKGDTLCLMMNSDMIVCKILGLETTNQEGGYKAEYLKVKIKGNDDRRQNVRKFRFDRKKQRLSYLHGKTITRSNMMNYAMIKFGEQMMTAGSIDLRELSTVLKEFNFERRWSARGEKVIGRPSIELGQGLLDSEESSVVFR